MSHPNADVRMRGFAQRSTVAEALAWLDRQLAPLPVETVPLGAAAGRVLASDVVSEVEVPGFDRAMMDGYAVQATDLQGASRDIPVSLVILGQALPGAAFAGTIASGQTVRVMTGAPMPAGADSVLPAELTEADGQRVLIHGEIPTGKNFGRRGEDIACGTRLLRAGRRLRPQDIGVLSSIGVAAVSVVRAPRVRIVVTGDELLPPGTRPHDDRITDANGPMLVALVARDGGLVARDGGLPQPIEMVPDRPEAILAALKRPCDVLLVSGGSSVGQEDHVPTLLAVHGELAIHGIAMRPSSPAGMGLIGEQNERRLVFLLPGNPVSALCAYDFFAGRAIRVLGGRRGEWPYRSARLPMAKKLASVFGRVDYARVLVANGQVEPLGISGASVLSSTTRADGFVIIPGESDGCQPGDEVEVFFYD